MSNRTYCPARPPAGPFCRRTASDPVWPEQIHVDPFVSVGVVLLIALLGHWSEKLSALSVSELISSAALTVSAAVAATPFESRIVTSTSVSAVTWLGTMVMEL